MVSLTRIVNFQHSGHCRACKARVHELLSIIYGACRTHRQFPWPARPEDYADTAIGETLQRICDALGAVRGHCDFIKSAQMPPCDYFIVDPPFIVEFDENQHFSQPRLAALANYPEQIAVGFSISRWQDLCREINAVDDTPFDRDERRAWYDTLRDLLPLVHGYRPTLRLYAGDFEFCALDANKAADRALFRQLLSDLSQSRRLPLV